MKFEIIMQLTYFKSIGGINKDYSWNRKFSLKIKFNCLRTNKSLFSLLGDKKNFMFGGI